VNVEKDVNENVGVDTVWGFCGLQTVRAQCVSISGGLHILVLVLTGASFANEAKPSQAKPAKPLMAILIPHVTWWVDVAAVTTAAAATAAASGGNSFGGNRMLTSF